MVGVEVEVREGSGVGVGLAMVPVMLCLPRRGWLSAGKEALYSTAYLTGAEHMSTPAAFMRSFDRGGRRVLTSMCALSLVVLGIAAPHSVVRSLEPPSFHKDSAQSAVWSRVSTPNPGAGSGLDSVVALSDRNAWAVGDRTIDRWNGTRWRSVPGAKMPSGSSWQLEDVVTIPGTNPRQLIAVGKTDLGPLAERWNGRRWLHMPSPRDELDQVAVISAHDIWGIAGNSAIDHWNGSKWTNFQWDYYACEEPKGITAVSTHDVYVVGYFSGVRECNGTGYYPPTPLIERWNGSHWVFPQDPSSVLQEPGYLNAVVALSANNVWAAGESFDYDNNPEGTLIYHWNGKAWTSVTSPSPDPTADFLSLAATSSHSIWAAGNYDTSPDESIPRSFLEHWNGHSWRVQRSAHPSQHDAISSVAAIPNTHRLWAVGEFAEQFSDNKWHTYPTPLIPRSDDVLEAASNVPGSDEGWAVGGTDMSPLLERWAAGTWSAVPSPDRAQGSLDAVSAITSNDVWAAGSSASGVGTIEHWDGNRWRATTMPGSDQLLGVSGSSSSNVWAVGIARTAQTMAERWNGRTWIPTATPKVPSGDSAWLTAVDAVGPHDVWSVGYRYNSGVIGGVGISYREAVMERWNGRSWEVVHDAAPTLQPHPKPDHPVQSALQSVSAVGPDDVWATGWWSDQDGIEHPLVEHWNGHTWRRSAPPGTCDISSIVAAAAGGVWAAAIPSDDESCTYGNGHPDIVVHWDGHRWSVSLPRASDPTEVINALALSNSSIWAVGSDESPYGVAQTVALGHAVTP